MDEVSIMKMQDEGDSSPGGAIELASRRRAREAALQALFQCDVLGEWEHRTIDAYFEHYVRPAPEGEEGSSHRENLAFSKQLAHGVIDTLAAIDRALVSASEHWSLKRMALVDRNILRVGVYEITTLHEIPVSVSINEAIEVAKRYSTQESSVFINGVLDSVAKASGRADRERARPAKKAVGEG